MTFDMKTYLDNAMTAQRAEKMKESDQLTLGELILKIEAIRKPKYEDTNDEPTVVYDFEYLYPTYLDSWRGIYAELALNFEWREHNPEAKPMAISAFLAMLKSAVGKTFTGYKGGEFLMGRQTPIWVSNHGNAGHTAVIDVLDNKYQVILITAYREP